MAEAATSIRVALIGCTGLLGEVIEQTIASQTDLDIVARLASPHPTVDLGEVDADVLLWNDVDEDRVRTWLSRWSRQHGPRVLATLVDGHRAALWELVPQRTDLGEPSPSTLLETLRATETSGP